jgi:hypothetical protein
MRLKRRARRLRTSKLQALANRHPADRRSVAPYATSASLPSGTRSAEPRDKYPASDRAISLLAGLKDYRRARADAKRVDKVRRPRRQLSPGGYTLASFDQYRCIFDNRRPGVDFVGRYEHIETDFRHVCDHFGIDATLSTLNAASTSRQD